MPTSPSLLERENVAPAQAPDPSQHILQFATAYVPCSALWVAAELKVADLIGAGEKPVAELAKKTKTNEDALFRILRLLAMVGIFTETEPRHFALTPPAATPAVRPSAIDARHGGVAGRSVSLQNCCGVTALGAHGAADD